MRFRLSIETWMEVGDLAEAQALMGRAEMAAHQALGTAAARDEVTAARWRGELTPIDRAAADALAADGLGPGISSSG